MLTVLEPLVPSKMVKIAILGLSLNFPGHGTPIGTRQTAIRAAKRRSDRETSNPRRYFIFDPKWPIFAILDLLGHSTSVLNCAL